MLQFAGDTTLIVIMKVIIWHYSMAPNIVDKLHPMKMLTTKLVVRTAINAVPTPRPKLSIISFFGRVI